MGFFSRGSGGSAGMTAPSARQMGSTSQTGAGASSGMSMQDLAAKLGDLGNMFGGQKPEEPEQPPMFDPGAASASLAAQLVQMLPALQRRPNMGLVRRV